jgi:TolB-like protein/Tfp pilus assembly protein PilF
LLLVDALVPRTDPGATSDASIAVLPFTSGGQADDRYFSEGLAEDLIITLAQASTLKVTSRNSSFRFRGNTSDSSSIGQQLGVAYLLQGNVRRVGEQMDIVIELINVHDATTTWTQRYTRPFHNLFALQDEIASAVADALKAKLTTGAPEQLQNDRPASGNLDAYNDFLQGRYYLERNSEADYRRAVQFYAAAVRKDPSYAAAQAGLAMAWTNLSSYYLAGAKAQEGYAQARAASAAALRLQPQLAIAHAARGLLLMNADMDWAGAESEMTRALQLAPNDNDVQSNLGMVFAAQGRLTQAVSLTRQSISSDPLHAMGYTQLAGYLAALGRLDEADRAIRKAIELQPEAGWERVQLVIIRIQRGDIEGAKSATNDVHEEGGWREVAQAFLQQAAGSHAEADAALNVLIRTQAELSAFQIAEVYAMRGDEDNTCHWLEQAWGNRDPGLARLWFDPFILRYKQDPRFISFCQRAGLPANGEGREPAIATPATPHIAAAAQGKTAP